jgi:hypothetical protein
MQLPSQDKIPQDILINYLHKKPADLIHIQPMKPFISEIISS